MLKYTILLILIAAPVYGQQPFDFEHLSTFAHINGEIKIIPCPVWDWSLVPEECRVPAMNCIPICGKYPGDKPDLGAMEWFTGQTNEKPWGNWTGIPLTDMAPSPPELKILEVE